MLDDQRWDVAWKIFDEINADLGQNQTIQLKNIWGKVDEFDLHCLDIEEAIAITKQKICDLAEELSSKSPEETSILALLCAKDHFVSKVGGEPQSGQMKDTDNELYDFSDENLTEGEPYYKKPESELNYHNL